MNLHELKDEILKQIKNLPGDNFTTVTEKKQILKILEDRIFMIDLKIAEVIYLGTIADKIISNFIRYMDRREENK